MATPHTQAEGSTFGAVAILGLTLLPIVLTNYIPTGVVGFLLAGLLAAFMSNFAATINADLLAFIKG